ncbi:MAG: O-antigen ligase domain-containing protein [Candidatus Hydrogenedentes bacterium]|nr:O-antigen ligase domain-containing protein [Candidatus Hydrogenedentota bacterium]
MDEIELGRGNLLVAVTLLAWFPTTMSLFMFMRPRRAVIAGFLIAWMFLPVAQYKFQALPELNKITITSLSLLLGVSIFDTSRLINFRPRWYDAPLLAFCLAPFASSLSNGLGAYDGGSESFRMILRWGIPYLIGRMYFTTLQGLKELALGFFIGGLIYIPLCLYEIRMSPQLHYIVYGYHQHSFIQHYRFGGWRPKVFMEHGLMVGMFMTAASLSGFWLWRAGVLKRIYGLPPALFVFSLLAVALMTRSAGSVILLFGGLGVLFAGQMTRSRVPLVALCVIPLLYVGFRITGAITGDLAAHVTEAALGADRAQSLETRFSNEMALSRHALEYPAFGWGGWNRSRIRDETGKDISITDSLWIIVFGMNGLFGLSMLGLMLVLPPLLLAWRVPPSTWTTPSCAGAAVLAVLIGLWIVDSTLNAMITPLYILAMGGLAGMHKVAPARVLRPVHIKLKAPSQPAAAEEPSPA